MGSLGPLKGMPHFHIIIRQDGCWIESDERNTLHKIIYKAYKLLFDFYNSVKNDIDEIERDGHNKYFMGLLAQNNSYFQIRRNICSFLQNVSK
jgi:hypothetical protein